MKGQSCQNLTKCGFCRRVYYGAGSRGVTKFLRVRGSDSADRALKDSQ